MEQHQRQQRAQTRRGQAGQNRQRMDEAFVKAAEDDVNDQNRGDQQESKPFLRRLKYLRRALKTATHGRRQVHFGLDSFQSLHGVAQGNAGRKIERNRHRRQLTDVRDARGADAAREFGEGAQRHQFVRER